MESIESELNKKDITESTKKVYLRNIAKLSKTLKFKNPLSGLKDIPAVEEYLKDYKPNTVRSYLISIVSVLPQGKLRDVYYAKMMESNKTLKEFEKSGVKTETQEKNWMDWTEVSKTESELEAKRKQSYNDFLNYLVLSLYTKLPPRRNEYRDLSIVKTSKGLSDTTNYLDLTSKQFVFNKFKTAKKEGQVKIDIPENLMSVISEYIKLRKLKPKDLPAPFLVDANGTPLTAVNAITRILNGIFHKKVSSSMLRHFYLSERWGDTLKKMEDDAHNMSHSSNTQKDYIKNE